MGSLKFHNELVFFTLITLINFSPLLTSFFRKSFYLFVFFLLLWRWNFLQWYLMFQTIVIDGIALDLTVDQYCDAEYLEILDGDGALDHSFGR